MQTLGDGKQYSIFVLICYLSGDKNNSKVCHEKLTVDRLRGLETGWVGKRKATVIHLTQNVSVHISMNCFQYLLKVVRPENGTTEEKKGGPVFLTKPQGFCYGYYYHYQSQWKNLMTQASHRVIFVPPLPKKQASSILYL